MSLDIIDYLMKAGFTRHESTLYITLCKEGELTGYEASKISGIPRSNAYLALAGLVDKGGAYRIDSDITKYTAVPAKELVFYIRRQMDKVFEFIERNAPTAGDSSEPYLTVVGKAHILNKISYIIKSADERIYLSIAPGELEYIEEDLIGARGKGLKIVIITSCPFEMDGVTVYHNEKQPGHIRLIADSSYVLTGEITDTAESTCLYSKNKNLIELIKDSLSNEIKLINIQRR